jgi:demethylmenaquinone methyltransferase/2-methoxy-6-polyprenyl-1,4-benzoquinol methylase
VEDDGSLSTVSPPQPPAAAKDREAYVYQIFQNISGTYDLMNDVESFRMHRGWKRALVNAETALAPKDMLDVACGTGDIALWLAAANPQAQITGFDFSENMLAIACKRAAELAAPNVAFIQGNAMDMPFEDARFDAVSISFGLRNVADYQRVVEEMLRVLRPGGSFFCLEASYPTAPIIKQGFRLYFEHILPFMGGLIAKRSGEYRWLNESTEAFLTKQQLAGLMQSCGLVDVSYQSFLLGSAALHRGCKPT